MSPSFSSLNLVLLGPPGSGRGTQGRILAERYELPHIATGAMLRDEAASGSPEGREIARAMQLGELVSDAPLSGMILRRLDRDDCARGFLLDGYPRTVEQAGLLDGILAELGRTIERVILLEVPDEVLLDRLTGRRVHEPSGRVYHVRSAPPVQDGHDDVTGEPLVHRAEDREDVARRRIESYHRVTAPLAELYRRRDLLVRIDGTLPTEAVTEAVMSAVGAPVGT